jgi:hypothetical protein
MTKHPSVKACTWLVLESTYGADSIRWALANFIVTFTQPTLSRSQQRVAAAAVLFRFQRVAVWHKIKFSIAQTQHDTSFLPRISDSVHGQPKCTDTQGRVIPGRFDTVLVGNGDGGDIGITGEQTSPLVCFQ